MGEAKQAGVGCNDACVQCMACGFGARWRLRDDNAGCCMACAQLACWSGGGGGPGGGGTQPGGGGIGGGGQIICDWAMATQPKKKTKKVIVFIVDNFRI